MPGWPCATMVLAFTAFGVFSSGLVADDRSTVAERVRLLSRTSAWTRVAAVPIRFRTFHPQGMVKIGEAFFVSSVEVRMPTKRFTKPVNGYDRDAGAGVGHLFKIEQHGNLLGSMTLAEGDAYHPGGIDYDGRHIWVPVSEYRPDSHSIIYKVDPATMKPIEVFRFPDSIGAIVHNTDDRTLHGVSWGSRRFYRWTMDRRTRDERRRATGKPADTQPFPLRGLSGLQIRGHPADVVHRTRRTPPDSHRAGVQARRLDLVSLEDGRPLHQVPVPLWTARGTDMTHNPPGLNRARRPARVFHARGRPIDALIYDVATR